MIFQVPAQAAKKESDSLRLSLSFWTSKRPIFDQRDTNHLRKDSLVTSHMLETSHHNIRVIVVDHIIGSRAIHPDALLADEPADTFDAESSMTIV